MKKFLLLFLSISVLTACAHHVSQPYGQAFPINSPQTQGK